MVMNEGELWVELRERRYPISIGHGVIRSLIPQLKGALLQGRTGAIVVDQGLLEANHEICNQIINTLPVLILPSGEKTKSSDKLVDVWSFLSSSKIDRGGFLVALGGGVIGDLSGFAAATFLRGISFYQVPSTLLAMVDSSVGGKTGINLPSGKNLVGSFHQPHGVWADLDLLDTLPPREFSAGMAEVIKYGLLGDRRLFELLLNLETKLSPRHPKLTEIIRTCCFNKAEIVKHDEKEIKSSGGGRALLNLGHTFAHAIEAVAGYGTYLHGEAVGIGLLCAWRLSVRSGYDLGFAESELIRLLKLYSLPCELKAGLPVDRLIEAMYADKKVKSGIINLILMKQIGEAFQQELESIEIVESIWLSVGAIKPSK